MQIIDNTRRLTRQLIDFVLRLIRPGRQLEFVSVALTEPDAPEPPAASFPELGPEQPEFEPEPAVVFIPEPAAPRAPTPPLPPRKQAAPNVDSSTPRQRTTRAPKKDRAPRFRGVETAKAPGTTRADVVNLRTAVLDDLDFYRKTIKRMRRADEQSFKLYSRVGANIVSGDVHRWNLGETKELEPMFRSVKPTFGAIAFMVSDVSDDDLGDDKLTTRFAYFTKFEKSPLGVQEVGEGSIYKVTAYLDRIKDSDRKSGEPFEFMVSLLDDGTIRCLAVKHTERQEIRHKIGTSRGTSSTISHQRWGIPPRMTYWANYHSASPVGFMRELFVTLANSWLLSSSSMIRISAKRGNICATFSVDMERMPRFFDDRDPVIGVNGSKARIFHVVRPHVRRLASGKTIAIKLHFAGMRKFFWNGYDITISVPGKHAFHLTELDMGVYDHDRAIEERLDMKRFTTHEKMVEFFGALTETQDLDVLKATLDRPTLGALH